MKVLAIAARSSAALVFIGTVLTLSPLPAAAAAPAVGGDHRIVSVAVPVSATGSVRVPINRPACILCFE